MRFHMLHPRDQLVAITNRIYHNGMATLSGGNLSIRDEDDNIWITPAGVDKGNLTPKDIICVKPDGTKLGPHSPSSELPFHRAIYTRRPDLRLPRCPRARAPCRFPSASCAHRRSRDRRSLEGISSRRRRGLNIMSETTVLDQLIFLSNTLGRPENDYVILGEGNTSARADTAAGGPASFYVKSSGTELRTITEARLRPGGIRAGAGPAGSREGLTDADVKAGLIAAKVDPQAPGHPSWRRCCTRLCLQPAGHQLRRPHAPGRDQLAHLLGRVRGRRTRAASSRTRSCCAALRR